VYLTGKPEHLPASYYKDEQREGWRENFIYRLPSGEIVAIYDDITDRKRAEEDLRLQREELQIVLDSVPALIFYKDANNNMMRANKTWLQTFGYTEHDINGKCLSEFVPAEQAAQFFRDDLGVVTSGYPKKNILEVIEIDGQPRMFLTDKIPYWNTNGEITGVIGFSLDITDRKKAEESLRESEERHRSLVKHLPQRVFIKNRNSVYVSCNSNYAAQLGITPEEIVGKDDFAFFPPELAQAYSADDQACMDTGMVIDLEETYQLAGQERWAHTIKVPYHDRQGRVIGVLGIFEDITERKGIEEDLRKSEATLRTVLQTTQIGIGLVTNRIFGWNNESLSHMTGYTADDLLGQSARMLYESDEEFDRVGTVKYGQIKAGGAGSVETRWKCKDGSVIDIFLSSSTIAPEDLSRGVVFSAIDISEHKRSEQDLRESEERIRLLIESAPIGIRIATQGRYSYVNPAFLNMFGYGCSEEIEGLPVEALYVEEDKCLIRERNAIRAKGLSVDPHYRVTGIRKDGTHIDLEAWGSEISYQGNRSTLRFLIDVTESNSLRAQLLHAQKMEAVGTLAGGIAHDFNNLLQAVLGYAEFMLQRKKEGEPDYADLQKIYKAGKRGADLVKSLLTFSQKVETKYVPVNLNQEITHIQSLLSRTIPKTIKIDLHLSGDLESINADPSQIGQVLMNLGVNARDAMPDGGTLTIETANVQLDKEYCNTHLEAKPGSYVLLTVSDTGLGMDRKTLSHIFEPFFTTKERGKGTGLGLATVYGIVKQHDGHIMCYSEPGHGTTFKIYLPAIQTKRDLEAPIIETAIPGGTETVLLVDDEEDIRDLGATLLDHFGYKVITAGNGKEALEIYKMEKDRISLILLDFIMPVMDGRQCLAEILRIDPNAKVIIASGYSESGPADGPMAVGAKAFVQKPYNMRQLLNTIREILDNDPPRPINAGDGRKTLS
jgi:PAS domain S-box-containing protein